MKLNIFLVVVGVTHCAAVLLNPPENANIVYKYDDFGRLDEVEIDHHHDPKPVRAAWNRASKPVPMPTFRRMPTPTAAPIMNIQRPRVTYQKAPAKLSRTPTTYKAPAPKQAPRTLYFVRDDDDYEQVFPMVFRMAAPAAPAPTRAPVTYGAPAPVFKKPAPAVYKAPVPVVYKAPAPTTYRAPAPTVYRAPTPVAKRPAFPYVRRFSVRDDDDDSDEDDK